MTLHLRSIVSFLLLSLYCAVGSAEAAPAPVPANLVSWWAGEDIGADLASGLDTLPFGTPVFTSGAVARAFLFDGVNDRYVTFEDDKHDITGDLTIEGWINIAGTSSNNRTIIIKPSSDGQNVCYSLSVNGAGKLTFSSTTAGSKTEVNTVAVLPVDTDVHVAITLLAGDLRMFINGAESAHIFFGTNRLATDAGVILGATTGSGVANAAYFAGEIDELSLYSRALSSAEIAGIHAAGGEGKSRFSAARDFERWSSTDAVQSGAWRYGNVPRESSGQPPVASFAQFSTGREDNGLNSWNGAAGLEVIANITGDFITRPVEGGTNIYYPPGALVLHPASNGQYATLQWTAPAAGDYAISAAFAGADGKPTTTDALVLAQTGFGVSTILPRAQINTCFYERNGFATPAFRKLALEAGEKIYFLVGYGSNADASSDSTLVFANIVPLRLLGGGGTPPTAGPGTPFNITENGATLEGFVDPNGAETSYRFEYGTTIAYGLSTEPRSAGSGTEPTVRSQAITGLTPNTLYHFRIVATNPSGTTNSADATFTTASGSGTPFTLRLNGQANGVVVRPETGVEIEAIIQPTGAGGATIASVQFFVNNEPRTADSEAPYEFESIVVAPGRREIYAVATDTLGRTATSEIVSFVVADASAGNLALQTFVDPENGQVTPGGAITYLLVATNTAVAAKPKDLEKKTVKGVKLTAPTPDGTSVESANFVDANNNPVKIKAPDGKNPAIARNGSGVEFFFGDIAPGQTKRARLKLRVPFDLHEGDDPIVNLGFAIAGKFGNSNFKGRFATKTLEITGQSPANAPQLALSKGIVDLEANQKDNTEFAATADGPIALTANGDKLTFLLVATNTGGLPASRVTLTDRVPEGFEFEDGSAQVNGRKAGGLFKAKGRTLTFSFGDFAPGQSLIITYQLKVKDARSGGPAIGEIVQTAPAELDAENLSRGVDSTPERLSIQILPPTTVIVQQPKALPEQITIGGLQTYQIPFTNPSKRDARNVRIRATVPEHTEFVRAFLEGAPAITFPVQPDNTVIFNVGTVLAGEGGTALLQVTGKPELLDSAQRGVVFQPPVVLGPTGGAFAARAAFPANAALDVTPFPLDLFGEFNPVRSTEVPLFGLAKVAPMSVNEGATFAIIYTALNYSATPCYVAGLGFTPPAGTEVVRADFGTDGSPAATGTVENGGVFLDIGELPPNGQKTLRVFFRATASAGTPIIENTAVATAFFPTPDVPAKPTATLIIRGEASEPDNQIAIARAQLSLENNDASVTMSDPLFLSRVKSINANSRYFFLNGTDGIQLLSGGAVVPTGAGRMVAAGGGNLIGNDGSTIENKGGATLIGNDGSTIVLYGPAEEIIFNLVGNDGASLIGLDGSTLLDKVVRGAAGNLVAAGGGNLVAAGGGNLVRSLIGNDGSTITQLIGNDGSTFAPGPLIASVQAAGGDVFAVGVGAFIPSAESIVSNGEAFLVAAGGGNLVAAGGGNIVTDNGAGLISVDHSRVSTYGLNGSVMATGGLNSGNGAPFSSSARGPRLRAREDEDKANPEAK